MDPDDRGDIEVTETDQGVSLTLRALHFVPDQAVILPEDRPLLDVLADALGRIPDRTFLVRGHTADVGTAESQFLLSEERARVVAAELAERGIPADRFVFQGLGGTEPVGDNTTEEGRRMNRRVEIIILED